MRTFNHFPKHTTCLICGTNDDKPCTLIPIDGTNKSNNCEAIPVHKVNITKCHNRNIVALNNINLQ